MNPHVSVSIIVFYISLAVCLFLIYAKPESLKKDGKLQLGGAGVVIGFTVGSFLFINMLSAELLIASLPIVVLGIAQDTGKYNDGFLKFVLIFLSSIFGAVALSLTRGDIYSIHTAKPLLIALSISVSILFVYLFDIVFSRIPAPAKWLIPLIFMVYALIFHKLNLKQVFEISLLMTVSTSGALIPDFPFKKIFFQKTGFYFSGFLFAEMLIICLLHMI